MVLEELANGRLIVECHTANEYAQIDEALKSFGAAILAVSAMWTMTKLHAIHITM